MVNEESLTQDVTQRAEEGEIEPAFGRVREVFAMLEVLARSKAKNVLLVGHPGVGKQHIVGGLALAGIEGETQGLLDNFRLLELDLGAMTLADRELENALRVLLKHLRKNRDTILFINEIHLVLQPDNSEMVNAKFQRILRPVLARGGITCIGSTTPQKFRQYFLSDPSMGRSFETIPIEPMSQTDTFDVLKKLRPELEIHHQVSVDEKTLRAAVVLTERYLTERYLPGKAIDVVDQACARYRFKTVAQKNHPGLIEDASLFMLKEEVTPHDVTKVIEGMVSLPAGGLVFQERWAEHKKSIGGEIAGQDFATAKTLACLRKAREQLSESNGPESTLFFVGSKNLGKRFLAERITETLYGTADKLFALDLANFEPEDLHSRLQANADTDLRDAEDPGENGARIYFAGVLLFESLDRAEPETVAYLTSMLEQGVLRESGRPDIVLTNCIVVLTAMADGAFPDRKDINTAYKQWVVGLRQIFPPALFNQIDLVAPFFPFEYPHLYSIMRIRINTLRDQLASRGIHVGMHKDAYTLLAAQGFGNGKTVGDLLETVDTQVIRPIHEMLESQHPGNGAEIHVLVEDDEIVFGGTVTEALGDSASR